MAVHRPAVSARLRHHHRQQPAPHAASSSIEGAAITAVRIEGVEHEFSPIPGVVEDATDIILNLKQIPFKIMGEGIKTVRLIAWISSGEVLSGQIETDAGRGSARPQRARGHRQRRRQAGHRDAPEERPRLRQRRQELRRRSGARLHPHRFGPLARAQSQLQRRSGPPRPDDRLRQADPGSLDQRRRFASGRHRLRGEAAQGPHVHLHQLRRVAGNHRGADRAQPWTRWART